ncbi:MAG: PilZ domain-containing protein [Sulfurisoma sp.]|nr:PilZ domain-containing protein [Sulfurisoma sp.]
MNDASNRRQFWRAAFDSTVRLTTDHGTVEARLLDISLKGALLEAPGRWQGRIGDPCHLKLHLAEGVVIAMWGQVAHLDGPNVGVRGESIDVDSITHLRRLVELNSGDPALLERELQTLLAP